VGMGYLHASGELVRDSGRHPHQLVQIVADLVDGEGFWLGQLAIWAERLRLPEVAHLVLKGAVEGGRGRAVIGIAAMQPPPPGHA